MFINATRIDGGGKVQIASGSYAGDGSTTKTIEIGFRPKFVELKYKINNSPSSSINDSSKVWIGQETERASSGGRYRTYQLTETGLTITAFNTGSDNQGNPVPNDCMNDQLYTYYWFAIG